jgi:hypothetical protein
VTHHLALVVLDTLTLGFDDKYISVWRVTCGLRSLLRWPTISLLLAGLSAAHLPQAPLGLAGHRHVSEVMNETVSQAALASPICTCSGLWLVTWGFFAMKSEAPWQARHIHVQYVFKMKFNALK